MTGFRARNRLLATADDLQPLARPVADIRNTCDVTAMTTDDKARIDQKLRKRVKHTLVEKSE